MTTLADGPKLIPSKVKQGSEPTEIKYPFYSPSEILILMFFHSIPKFFTLVEVVGERLAKLITKMINLLVKYN